MNPSSINLMHAPAWLWPYIDSLHSIDCRSVDPSTLFVRFSGDTAMLVLNSDFTPYQSYLSSLVHFSSWCSANLNVSKTIEMCLDFRCNGTVICPIALNFELVFDSFMYLGVVLDKNYPLQSMLQPCKRSLSSDCTFFESCEPSM